MTDDSSSTSPSQPQGYRLILFVADGEPNSTRARENIDRICANHLGPHCDLQIVDVLNDYKAALQHKVLVTPCLVMLEPPPAVKIAGTLQDAAKVLAALRLPAH